ncbi:hypothetical protein [Candidatus Sodalis sp. SoCistrobi]|uniref:hypothetical protein n=1 Tax=Candidatus Sodalis sp. SoCistrobi TaxID=1922216 RepID=UPI00157752DF|nr:hypothetical protein [Candidatus Sodalis sp. SoCistrobi]
MKEFIASINKTLALVLATLTLSWSIGFGLTAGSAMALEVRKLVVEITTRHV